MIDSQTNFDFRKTTVNKISGGSPKGRLIDNVNTSHCAGAIFVGILDDCIHGS